MPTSDEALESKKSEVEKLRQQVADEEAKRLQQAREVSNDVIAGQLDAEAERLHAQLAELKAGNTKKAATEGAAAVLDPQGNAERVEKAKLEAQAKDEQQLVDSGAAAEGAKPKRGRGDS